MAGIYIHIPFCAKRCGYCDFFSSTERGLMPAVLDEIEREIASERGWIDEEIETIYFGGGTPSLVAPERLQRIINAIGATAPKEITAEANPDDLTEEYLHKLAQTDIDRLSIGIQSFIDRDLRLMGRRHDAKTAREAVRNAQQAGFANITIDLIFGIPGMSAQEWRENLQQALELQVQHISAYHLTLEQGTPMARLAPVDEQASEEQFKILHDMLIQAGFEHYEVSNFALPNHRAAHNSNYWNGTPYLGVGAGAHSFNGFSRRHFDGTLQDYAAGHMLYNVEHLTPADRHNELIMTRLRTAAGIADTLIEPPQKLLDGGLLLHENGSYRIPPDKFLLSDWVISQMFD